MNKNYYCVILAGGIGLRLWPSSRQMKPKQFLDILGTGESLLQATYRRYARFIDKQNIIVMSNERYADLTRKQLPDLPKENLLLEPMRRNTVPSVTWAAIHISRYNPEALMLITPADQLITDDIALQNDVTKGFEYIENNQRLLTMGIMPTRPETSFGYIQMANDLGNDIYKVKSFTEKPELEFANMFINSKEFLWNTGLFMWSASTYLNTIKNMSNEFSDVMESVETALRGGEARPGLIGDAFSISPNIPLETGILEKVDNVDVMQCHFGWSDLGTWSQIYNTLPKQKGDNVVVNSKALFYNSKNNVVKLPEGHIAVLQDLEGYTVVEEDNILLICKKDDQQAMRKIVNDVQMDIGDDFL